MLNSTHSLVLFNYYNKSSALAEMGHRLATVDMGRKVGVAVPLFGGELGPHLTQWPTSLPSGILIRPTVWPQYANVTDRQDRQRGQRADSTGRTVIF